MDLVRNGSESEDTDDDREWQETGEDMVLQMVHSELKIIHQTSSVRDQLEENIDAVAQQTSVSISSLNVKQTLRKF